MELQIYDSHRPQIGVAPFVLEEDQGLKGSPHLSDAHNNCASLRDMIMLRRAGYDHSVADYQDDPSSSSFPKPLAKHKHLPF